MILPRVRLELTAFRLWDLRAANCANEARPDYCTTFSLNGPPGRSSLLGHVEPHTWRIVEIPLPPHLTIASLLCCLCLFPLCVYICIFVTFVSPSHALCILFSPTNRQFSPQLHPLTARGVWRPPVNTQPRPLPPVAHSTSSTGRAGKRHTNMHMKPLRLGGRDFLETWIYLNLE